MGSLFSFKKKDNSQSVTKSKAQEQVYQVDIVKAKLKIARDRVKNMIKSKNNDISKIQQQIKQQLPEYQESGNKKKLVPLLKAKKDLQTFVDNAQVRVKLLNQKISEVQMQQVNADTINALDDSNKYIQEMQSYMQKKDWQGVIDDAKQKYQLQWPQDQQNVQDDPAFQEMWKQIGGNKLKQVNQKIQKKKINIQIPQDNKQTKVEKLQNKQEALIV